MHRSAAILREEWWPSDRQTSYAYTGQRAPRGPRLQLGSRISAGVVIPGVFPQLSGLLPWGRCFRSCDCVTLCETWPGQILRRNSLKSLLPSLGGSIVPETCAVPEGSCRLKKASSTAMIAVHLAPLCPCKSLISVAATHCLVARSRFEKRSISTPLESLCPDRQPSRA